MGAVRALGLRLLVVIPLFSNRVATALAPTTCAGTVFAHAPMTPVIGRAPTADVNGDGRLDFATYAGTSGRIGVYLGVGDGSFAAPLVRDVSFGVSAFTLGDFDGDGKADLVTANFQFLQFYKGNGDGTFQDPVNTSIPNFFEPAFLVTADLDVDGKLDLFGPLNGGTVFFRGKGDGTFFAPVTSAGVPLGDHFALADLDGDTIPDLVMPNGGSVDVRLGKGDGTFGDSNLYAAGTNVFSVAVADFDLDGKADIVAAVPGKVAYLKGLGDGGFLASVEYDVGVDPGDVVAADFDRDGKPDIAVSGAGNYFDVSGTGVAVLYGNGQGSFEDRRGYYAPVPGRLVAGDFDADGVPDLASFADQGVVSVLLNLETRSFQAAANFDLARPAVLLVSADFDGDGRLDLAAGDSTGIQVLLGEDHGLFQTGISLVPANDQFSSLATADFDGDGKPDLAIVRSRDFAVHLGKGDGTFRDPISHPLGGFVAGPIQAADFDHDGKPDLAVAWGDGSTFQIGIFRGRGDGTFVDGPSAQPIGFLPTTMVAADLNGDGIPDVVAVGSDYNNADYVLVFFSNGDGTLSPALDLAAGDNPAGAAVGDFDEDGIPDLLVSNAGSGNVSLFFGNGDGSFAPPVQIGLAWYPNRIVVADFDGDGHQDFAVTSSGLVAVALGLGQGGFRSPLAYGVPADTIPAIVGDFDRNGSTDLAVGTGSRSVAVLFNSRLSVSPPPAQVVCGGADAVFSVRSSGFGAVHYRWRRDGTPLSDGGNVSGATRAALHVAAPSASDEGMYDVIVTDACGSATSAGASLAIAPKPPTPTITAPASAPPGATGLAASVIGAPGHSYEWSLTGGTITAGQGTSAIAFTAGAAGTTMSLRVADVLDAGCVSDPGEALVQTDFLDVPPSHLYHGAVVAVAAAGISSGCGGGKYCPDQLVTRDQMSVFILRGEHGGSYTPPGATGTVFSDVGVGTPFARWIEQFGAEGISTGCAGGSPPPYCPTQSVTRDAMAKFLLLGKHGSGFDPGPATGTVFGDIRADTFLAKWIERLNVEGITGGCGGGNYCPHGTVTRGEMAALIRRTFGL